MKDSPTVSVVMSVYNGEKYLEEAVQSILGQTFQDFEFIIVNDGSTDRSLEIIKRYAADDKRIVVIDYSNNIGLTRALNNAIRSARGQYIVRQDADDISAPVRVERQVAAAEQNTSAGLVSCRVQLFSDSGNIRSLYDLIPTPLFKLFIYTGNIIVHGSVLFEKKLFQEVGGYRENFRYSQDYDLWLRMMEKKDFIMTGERLYSFRISGESISSIQYDSQTFFAAAALYFFFQRRFSGKDGYEDMGNEILKRKTVFKVIHKTILLRHGKFREVFSY